MEKDNYEQYKAEQAFADYGLDEPVIEGNPVVMTNLVDNFGLDNYLLWQVFFRYSTRQNNTDLIFWREDGLAMMVITTEKSFGQR
jgi:hypothetical protein